MTANRNQESAFGREFLDNILEWIGSQMHPDDVFSEEILVSWARTWAKKQEEWIPDPDRWAVENGYVRV